MWGSITIKTAVIRRIHASLKRWNCKSAGKVFVSLMCWQFCLSVNIFFCRYIFPRMERLCVISFDSGAAMDFRCPFLDRHFMISMKRQLFQCISEFISSKDLFGNMKRIFMIIIYQVFNQHQGRSSGNVQKCSFIGGSVA